MADKPLWSDDKINSLTLKNANNLDPDARWMHEQIAKDMRDDYERALAFRNEDIGRLQGELGKALARIAELEAAQQWQPMNKEIYRDGLAKVLLYDNQMQVNFDDKTPIMVYLDNDIRLCRKIQPAA